MDDLTALIMQAVRDADADTLGYERRTPDDGYGTHAAAVMSVVAPAIQAEKAEAWDEGCEAFEIAHKCDHIEPWGHLRDNPYRQEQTTGLRRALDGEQ